jgi:hypothetical protein
MDMSEADKAKLRKLNAGMNAILQEHFAEFLPKIRGFSGLMDDGKPVEWDLKPGRHLYLFYENKRTKARYCYTPWKDTKGWYWAFTYAPRGKGSRSGDPDRLVVTDAVKFRKRKTAVSRAYARYCKAN